MLLKTEHKLSVNIGRFKLCIVGKESASDPSIVRVVLIQQSFIRGRD